MSRELSGKTERSPGARKSEGDPVREMIGFRDTINGMFEDFFRGRPLLASSFFEPALTETEASGWIPPVDIRETGDELVVRAGMPGLRKEDCRIEVKDKTLILSGERKDPEEGVDYLRRELPCGSFHRAFTLPMEVKSEQVKASYRDGVLEIRLPKSEAAKPVAVKIE